MKLGALALGTVLGLLLGLLVLGKAGFAGGDLFDADYADCPSWSRLSAGQVRDLTVTRDADDAHTVHVAWRATDPDTWGMGPNAFHAQLVAILDDGGRSPVVQSLSLGSRRAVFDEVRTGTEVTVQLGIVVETPDHAYLVSDTVSTTIDQSLTEPAFFTTQWMQGVAPHLPQAPVPGGTFYYVGYNEAFGNYRAASGLLTRPHTPRLRIGLAHGGESDEQRDTVDFDSYVIRITDEDGDVVPEGHDVTTLRSDYGDKQLVTWCIMQSLADNTDPFSNLRVVDDGDILASMYASPPGFVLDPESSAMLFKEVILERSGTAVLGVPASLAAVVTPERVIEDTADPQTFLYAPPPDEHRDFPIDVLASDTTYVLAAWAVNGDGETISPVATLKVRPQDRSYRDAINMVQDYVSLEEIVRQPNVGKNPNVADFVLTAFTVLK